MGAWTKYLPKNVGSCPGHHHQLIARNLVFEIIRGESPLIHKICVTKLALNSLNYTENRLKRKQISSHKLGKQKPSLSQGFHLLLQRFSASRSLQSLFAEFLCVFFTFFYVCFYMCLLRRVLPVCRDLIIIEIFWYGVRIQELQIRASLKDDFRILKFILRIC